MIRYSKICLIIACSLSGAVLFAGCSDRNANAGPSVHFSQVPLAEEGGPDRLTPITGHVFGARPGQQIVLFAQEGPWWIQPRADQPFTQIQPDSSWRGKTHFGEKYAALLVDPGYQPLPKMDFLPGEGSGVVAIAVTNGLPPFWQTWWFLLCFALGIGILGTILFRIRVQKLTTQLMLRLEVRLAERTRIARDLHDTLLQSFHGLLLSFQTVHDLLPTRPEEAKEILASAIDQAEQAITEGRDAVQGLRSSTVETNDIAEAIKSIGEELANGTTSQPPPVFRLEVEGMSRNLHPILRDEVYRTASEALRNAFRHAQARKIEVEIHHDDRKFRLRVRDDGKGIDLDVLGGDGRAGHYGLYGMRERAKLAGGKLAVWSEIDSGTEIELTIPAAVAYAKPPSRFWWSDQLSRKWKSKRKRA